MSHDLSWMKLTGDIRTGLLQSVQSLFTQHSQNTKHLWNTWVVWDWLCCRRIFECATQNWPNHAESLFQNSLCQLADFRQQGGLSFVIPVTLYRKERKSRQHNRNESPAEFKISYLLWCADRKTYVHFSHSPPRCRHLRADLSLANTSYSSLGS